MDHHTTKHFRVLLPIKVAVLLTLAGVVPAGSARAYSQRRPLPSTSQGQGNSFVYGQGYQKGYFDGFTQGSVDFRQRTPRDFQHSDTFQQRDQRYDQRWASSQQYHDGFDLGFELGYTDGYYGRPRNAAVPANVSLLAIARQPAPVELSVYAQGYQKGYGDGYAEGPSDSRQRASRDFQHSNAYQQRNQRYDQRWASSQEYRDGYSLGFERGYADGYDGRQRNSTVPQRVAQVEPDRQRVAQVEPDRRDLRVSVVDVQIDTEMRLRLSSSINTSTNRVGDRFSAIVTAPREFEGAAVDGHISSLIRSDRTSGRTELSLAFDSITLRDGRRGPLAAQVQRVIESENVKTVDEEGRIETGRRTRDSDGRGGGDAIIGGITDGARGALIGALGGSSSSGGTVYVEGHKHMVLEQGTELLIRIVREQRRSEQ